LDRSTQYTDSEPHTPRDMADTKYKFGNLHLKNAKEVSDYTQKVIADAENLITNIIPDKIFSLEKVDKEEFQQYADINSVTKDVNIPSGGYESYMHKNFANNGHENNHSDTPAGGKKKRKIEELEPDERPPQIPCNMRLLRLIDVMKPEIKDVIQACELIKMWISLLIPRIEDGNNFGVGIQEEVLNEVHRIQTESVNYLDAISRYFITRAKIISKVAKYPYVDDYNRAVKEVDEKEYLNVQFSINEIRSHYMLILDVVSKNYEKIKKPRSSNNLESMY
jgi:proteasome activator subunit 3 (PA28 gamma)